MNGNLRNQRFYLKYCLCVSKYLVFCLMILLTRGVVMLQVVGLNLCLSSSN